MKQQRKRLGDLLVDAKLITEKQLLHTLQQKRDAQKLGEALIQEGVITEQQLIEVLEKQLGIPRVSLYNYPIEKSLMNVIPKEMAKRNMLFPLRIERDKLFVAMVDPMDFYAVDDLRMATGFQIERVIATRDDVIKSINKYYGLDDSMKELLEELPEHQEVDDNQIRDEDSPIVKLVNQILLNGVLQKVSDIHIDPQEKSLVVRYRIDGVLKTEKSFPRHMQNMLTARLKIMSNLNITEHRVPQDGRIQVTIERHSIDIRVSTLPTVYGEKVVMRILDNSSASRDLEKLGFQSNNLKQFVKLIEQPTGVVLVTGPTGSGKSSTLYSALNRLNSEEVNIITVEDPVEYRLEGINQIQVNPVVGLTFAKGLRAILRQDPDIVMVGEIRDAETAEIAIRASLTGHLVLSTLHTNDSISTITRLVDMGVEPFLVAASVSGILAQRLVRRVCRDCQEVYLPTEREKQIFAERKMKVDQIIRGKGCGNCSMTGYKGRLPIHELLVIDDEIRKMIMNNSPISMIRDYAIDKGTVFLVDDGLLKVKEGLTTTEEVLRVAISE